MKTRLDILVYNRALAPSREKARSLIMEGCVYVKGRQSDKPGELFDEASDIEIRGEKLRYVSRGGLKLERALECFGIDIAGAICADIGASTGGFTDCMLQHGAAKVYAVDVGYGQLAWQLREDPRVINLERQNIRYLDLSLIESSPDFITVDVSFISLSHVLPVAAKLIKPEGRMVCLIKPQFEATRQQVGKKGVVRDKSVHIEVIEKIIKLSRENGFAPLALDHSPIKGPNGNIEYLIYMRCGGLPAQYDLEPSQVVEAAHAQLNRPKEE